MISLSAVNEFRSRRLDFQEMQELIMTGQLVLVNNHDSIIGDSVAHQTVCTIISIGLLRSDFVTRTISQLEHRMGVEPMNTGFAGEKNGLFSVTYGKLRSL
jgi:hypothetical protein